MTIETSVERRTTSGREAQGDRHLWRARLIQVESHRFELCLQRTDKRGSHLTSTITSPASSQQFSDALRHRGPSRLGGIGHGTRWSSAHTVLRGTGPRMTPAMVREDLDDERAPSALRVRVGLTRRAGRCPGVTVSSTLSSVSQRAVRLNGKTLNWKDPALYPSCAAAFLASSANDVLGRIVGSLRGIDGRAGYLGGWEEAAR